MYRKIVKSRERVARKLKKLTPLDIFYLMQKNITCTYFYKEMIDKDLLVRSVSELVKIYPFLSGRIQHKNRLLSRSMFCNYNVVQTGDGIPITFTTKTQKYPLNYVKDIDNDLEANFLDMESNISIYKGKAPLMSIVMTEYNASSCCGKHKGDGCSLGVAISHGVVDGFSFHKIVNVLSDIYNNNGDLLLLHDSKIEYNDMCYYKQLEEHRAEALNVAISNTENHNVNSTDYSTMSNFLLLNCMLYLEDKIRSKNRSNKKRVKLEFTADDMKCISSLKAKQNFMISTTDMLCTLILTTLFDSNSMPSTIATTINIRSQHVNYLTEEYIGNAVQTIYESDPINGSRNDTELEDDSRRSFLNDTLSKFYNLKRQIHNNDAIIQNNYYKKLNELENSIINVEEALLNDVLFVNNQISFPMLPKFGNSNPCIGVVPGKSDDVHVIPAPNNGVDVYLSNHILEKSTQVKYNKNNTDIVLFSKIIKQQVLDKTYV